MTYRPRTALLWFGVLGGSLAWAVQMVAGYAFGLAQCDQPTPRWHLAVHAWQVALAAGGVAIGIAAEIVCLRIFLATREADNAPPAGRVHFLGVIGLTVNPLAIAIMVMTAIGSPFLHLCQQS
jgi:hypothetical protein